MVPKLSIKATLKNSDGKIFSDRCFVISDIEKNFSDGRFGNSDIEKKIVTVIFHLVTFQIRIVTFFQRHKISGQCYFYYLSIFFITRKSAALGAINSPVTSKMSAEIAESFSAGYF